jgi:hypothetical protein
VRTDYDEDEPEESSEEEEEQSEPLFGAGWCSLCNGRGIIVGLRCPVCSGQARLRAASRRLRRLLGVLGRRARRGGRRGARRRLWRQVWPVWSVGGWPEFAPGAETSGGIVPEPEPPERVPEMQERRMPEEVAWPEFVAPDYVAEVAPSFGVPRGLGDVDVEIPGAEISLTAPPDRPMIVSAGAVVEASPDLAGAGVPPLAPGLVPEMDLGPRSPLAKEINYDITGGQFEVVPGSPLDMGVVGF